MKAVFIDSPWHISIKEIDLMGSKNSCKNFSESIDIIVNKKIDVKGVFLHMISFEEIPFIVDDISKNPGDYMKVVAIL
jgi:hypothetical protein